MVIGSVNSRYLRGSMGRYTPQKTLVLNDYSQCFSRIKHLSLRQTAVHRYLCVKSNLNHCILTSPVEYSHAAAIDAFLPLRNSRYCGSAWMHGKTRISLVGYIVLSVKYNHKIHVSILHFNFVVSKHVICRQHGMVLSYLGFQSETYCGTRIPWELVTRGNRLFLNLTLTEYKDYSLQLHYSGFHTSWIRDISTVFKAYQNAKSLVYIATPVTYFLINVKSYEYYLISHQENYFEIQILNDMNTSTAIFDGPGDLSPTIFLTEVSKIAGSKLAQTSAYLAFVRVMLLDRNSSVRLEMTTNYNIGRGVKCSSQRRGIIVAKSTKRSNLFCMGQFQTRRYHIKINVRTFNFVGPNMMSDLSDSACQYGGLVVQFHGRNKQHNFCESMDNFPIYSEHQGLTFIVVWFSGYSRGEFKAFLAGEVCSIHYTDLNISRMSLMTPEITVRHSRDVSNGCTVFISPTLQNKKQRRFILLLGPPALGSVHIIIQKMYTLSACYSEYTDTDNNLMININTVSFDNWPLYVVSKVSHGVFDKTSHVEEKFNYLHSGNISLPYTCDKYSNHSQTAIILRVATCISTAFTYAHLESLSRRIIHLAEECVRTIFYFTPTGARKAIQTFVYKDVGHASPGLVLYVDYHDCSLECRKYSYSTFVKSVDGKTVLEYTTNIGQKTSIGYYHRGFRVSVQIPDVKCIQHAKCSLLIYTTELIAAKQDFPDITYTLHHYGKR